tara:strand:+ start:6823 stop:7605 length:783 start_codon:yes stop_codon:yes gene_type:complete
MNNTSSSLDVRLKARNGNNFTTSGLANGFVQTNVVVIQKEFAYDFMLYCQRNPKPCPLIEVFDPGEFSSLNAKNSDIRTDVPEYKIFKNGKFFNFSENIKSFWREDFVTFLLGCSFTFENELIKNGIDLPYFKLGKNVPMFITSIDTKKSGKFSGKMVVTQRWIPREKVVRTIQITSRFPNQHGTPIQVGNSEEIGILDPHKPDFGNSWIPNNKNLVPVYWACGVTPQIAIQNAKLEIVITHSPGKMFITDLKDEDMAVI